MMMKKILSVALAGSMLLGTPAISFAAPTSEKLIQNIQNEDVSKAVSRLSAFGIVNGMGDGEYHPEEMVTREQFAKLVVESLGLGNAVDAAKGKTRFTDVPADSWSTGYINVAVGQGIIKGIGNGKFAPTKEVSYAEAVTMLVRALGYKDQFLEGSWPGNYVAKAAELDITDDVNTMNGSADRGDVAIMVNNTLDANMIKVNAYKDGGMEYSETGETLLNDKLDADKVSDLRIVATSEMDASLENDEVKVMAIKKDVVIDGQDLDKYDQTTIDTKVDLEALLGQEITGYFDGDELVYAENESNSKNVFKTLVKDDGDDYENVIIEGAPNDDYGWDNEAVVYINDEDVNFSGETTDAGRNAIEKELDTDFVFARKVVVEDGDIVYLDAVKFEDKYTNMVINSVDVNKERINYFETFNGKDDDKDLKLDDYDYYDIHTEEGIKLELEDLEENDVIYFVEEADDDARAHLIVANDRAVTGELDSFRKGVDGSGHDRGTVKIDGENYDLQDALTFTDDNMDTITEYTHLSDLTDTLEDIYGEDVTVIRDIRGRVAFLSSTVESTVDSYAVVIGMDTKYGDTELKVWNTNGTVAYYEFDDDKLPLSVIEKVGTAYATIIKYDLNSNGDKIKIEEAYTIKADKTVSAYKDGDASFSATVSDLDGSDTFEDDRIRVAGSDFYNKSDSLYLDYADFFTGFDDDDLEMVEWADLEGNDATAGSKALILEDEEHNEVDLMVFVDDADVVDSDVYEGYVVSVESGKDDDTVVIDVVGAGLKTYTIDTGDNVAKAESMIVFTEKGSNDINVLEHDDVKWTAAEENITTGSAYVVDVDGRYITLNEEGVGTSNVEYKMSSDVVVYLDADVDEKSSLEEGYPVNFLAKDGEIVVIQFLDDEYEKDATTGEYTEK